MGFFTGIVQQVIAGVVVLILGYWIGRASTLRKAARLIASGSDVALKGIYKSADEAKNVIRSTLVESRSVRILAGRGTEFQTGRDGTYEEALTPGERDRRHWRILLPDTRGMPRGEDWIAYRARELDTVRPPYDRERLAQQITSAEQELAPLVEPGKFELALYDAPHVGRIILTDDSLFLSFYDAGRGGKKGPTFHFGRGEFYNAFTRYFEMVWRDSRLISSAIPPEPRGGTTGDTEEGKTKP